MLNNISHINKGDAKLSVKLPKNHFMPSPLRRERILPSGSAALIIHEMRITNTCMINNIIAVIANIRSLFLFICHQIIYI